MILLPALVKLAAVSVPVIVKLLKVNVAPESIFCGSVNVIAALLFPPEVLALTYT